MEKYKSQIIALIKALVSYPSVYKPVAGYCLGESIDQCLDFMLDFMSSYGFKSYKEPQGYYGYSEIGEGELFAILIHLDVVDAKISEGWDTLPFVATESEGYLIGRGVQDDKGPGAAAIFALIALLEEGYKLNRRVRFIFGADEETQWRCISKYKETQEIPLIGFTPDASFPLIYGEKGLLQLEMTSCINDSFSLNGGDTFNAVPTWASCVIDDRIVNQLTKRGILYQQDEVSVTIEGRGAHAKNPWKGENAIYSLVQALAKIDTANLVYKFIGERLVDKHRFEGFVEGGLKDFSGETTINLGMIKSTEEGIKLYLDIRYPITVAQSQVYEAVEGIGEKYGLKTKLFDGLLPHYVEQESFLIKHLLKAYQEETGDFLSQPLISAGATYGRAFKNHVAFGSNFPNQPTSEHQCNEKVKITSIIKAAKIYKAALKTLVCDINN